MTWFDSGQSLQRSIAWLENRYGFYIDEVRTAVLWHKECSVITPRLRCTLPGR